MPTVTDFFLETNQSPTWYVYDQFTQPHFSAQSEAGQAFDPIVEFEFPPTTLATGELRRAGNKEIHYRRVFNHPYSMETFSGDVTLSMSKGDITDPVQLGHAYAPTKLRQAGRYQYFYFNQRNDVTSLLKHNGQSLHSYLYDEYGMMYDNNKKPRNASNFTDPHNHYTFSAKEFDEESQLSYFGARYYDSWSGTWATQDRYRGDYFDPQTLHRYAFVVNNPINLIDRYGFRHEEFQEEHSGFWYDLSVTLEKSIEDQKEYKRLKQEHAQLDRKIAEAEAAHELQVHAYEKSQVWKELEYKARQKAWPNAKIFMEQFEKDGTLVTRAEFCADKVKERNRMICKTWMEMEEIRKWSSGGESSIERFIENAKRATEEIASSLVGEERVLVAEGYSVGVFKGAWNTLKGTAWVARHPILTKQAIEAVIENPEIIKEALGTKWEEFQNADYYRQGEMIGEIVGEVMTPAAILKIAKKLKMAQKAAGLTVKISKQLSKRGWTEELLQKTINNAYTTRQAINKATGNKATAFFTKEGAYIVRDNITGEIIQVSDRFNPNWIPDSSIINPYIPK